MRYALAAGLLAVASAAPLETRATAINDAQILNYALTLEYLESTFYNNTLAMFTADDFKNAGLPDYFYGDLQEIAKDEATHVSFLSGALTGKSDIHLRRTTLTSLQLLVTKQHLLAHTTSASPP